MRRLSHRSFHLLVIALACLQTAALSAATVDEVARGFSIDLPRGWLTIPKETLDNYSDMMAVRSGGKVNERYQHGYQRGFNGQWLIHPYVLVQVKETGRVPDGQLRQMKPFHAGVERGLNKAAENLSGLLSGAALGETLYDATNHCIWMHFSAEVAGIGPIKAVTCGFLTEKGVIFFHCYAKAAEFDALLPAFQQLLASVKIAENLKYKSRLGDAAGFDFSKILRSTIIGGVVGGLVGLVVWLAKKLKPAKGGGSPPPPVP